MMRWGLIKTVVAVIAGVAIVAVCAAETRILARDGSSAPPHFIGRLNDGISFELLAVGNYPEGNANQRWWLPDGTSLRVAPCDHIGGDVQNDVPGTIVRSFVAKVNAALPVTQVPATVNWSVHETKSGGTATCRDRIGGEEDHLQANVVAIPDTPDGATVGAKIATGPWRTVCTATATEGDMYSAGRDDFIFLSSVYEKNGHACIAVAHSLLENVDYRIIAIDSKGVIIPYIGGSGMTMHGNSMDQDEVSISLRQIKNFQFQTRPWNQWIEIRHISLHANHPSQVEIATSDAPGTQAAK